MDIQRLYMDFSVDFKTEGHKHTRDGWVNTPCVWCTTDNPGYHLGYNLNGGYYFCWKCGWHAVLPTLSKLLKMPEKEVHHITKEYGLLISYEKRELKIDKEKLPHILPSNVMELQQIHRRYLEGRGFDADMLINKWKLTGTGPISILKTNNKVLDYRFRILIPFIWHGHQVSFDSRDITGNAIAKYMACPSEREKLSHKDILYGNEEAWGDTIIVVEGPTDVWRFGDNAVATSGIKYTNKQMRLLVALFRRIFVCFDGGEAQANQCAKDLVADLRFRGREAYQVEIEGDPGAMPQWKADKLVKRLLQS